MLAHYERAIYETDPTNIFYSLQAVTKPTCVKVLKPDGVATVACGKAHTVAWTRSAKLVAFGSNAEGQLGLGKGVELSEKPQEVLLHMRKLPFCSFTKDIFCCFSLNL
jgi:alpha-tubulin suppressor-like RCC1 family protein